MVSYLLELSMVPTDWSSNLIKVESMQQRFTEIKVKEHEQRHWMASKMVVFQF